MYCRKLVCKMIFFSSLPKSILRAVFLHLPFFRCYFHVPYMNSIVIFWWYYSFSLSALAGWVRWSFSCSEKRRRAKQKTTCYAQHHKLKHRCYTFESFSLKFYFLRYGISFQFPISGNINPLILLMQPYPEDLSSTKVHFQKEALILRFLPAFPLSFSYAHTVLGGFCVSFADAKKYALKWYCHLLTASVYALPYNHWTKDALNNEFPPPPEKQ